MDHLWKRALAYDMNHGDVDGMDVIAVKNSVQKIVTEMRETKKPYLLEALTYRYRGHSVSDPGTYRTKEEVKEYQEKRDPIKRLGSFLQAQGFASPTELKEWDKEAKAKVDEAEKFADEAEYPKPEEALEDVLYEER